MISAKDVLQVIQELEKASRCQKCSKKLIWVMLPVGYCPKHKEVILPKKIPDTESLYKKISKTI